MDMPSLGILSREAMLAFLVSSSAAAARSGTGDRLVQELVEVPDLQFLIAGEGHRGLARGLHALLYVGHVVKVLVEDPREVRPDLMAGGEVLVLTEVVRGHRGRALARV